MVPSAQHLPLVVAGKMPFRNTLCPKAQHDPGLPQQSHPPQGPVRQGFSDPGCTLGARAPKNGSCGRLPRKRPSLSPPSPSKRSLLGSHLAGRLRGPVGREGVRRGCPEVLCSPPALSHSLGHDLSPRTRMVPDSPIKSAHLCVAATSKSAVRPTLTEITSCEIDTQSPWT